MAATDGRLSVESFAPAGSSEHERVRRRTLTQFEKAALLMPATQDDGSASALAPLIVVNTGSARTVTLASVDRFTDAVRVGGQRYEVLDYAWFLSAMPDPNSASVDDGYRLSLLLGADGFPIVVRVVRLRPGAQDRPVYFVSRSLEDAAVERFGSPLPGRAFAVEALLADAPGFFVAGVFDDGPIPMGPYVYLDPNGVGVVTVLCRCAAAQADDFTMTAYYDLVDVETGVPSGDEAARAEVDDSFSTLTEVLRWPLRASDAGGPPREAPR